MLIRPPLRHSYLKNWPWKSKVKIMGEVKVQSHNMSLTSYWLTSNPFGSMSIDAPITEILRFQNLTLKIQSQSHSSRSYSRYNTLSTHIPCVPCWSALPYLGYSYFKIWHWKFKVKVMGKVKVGSHNMSPTFNMVPSDPFMSHLATQLGYSAGEFQALQLIVLAAFGVVD